jgi:hypothetical protein
MMCIYVRWLEYQNVTVVMLRVSILSTLYYLKLYSLLYCINLGTWNMWDRLSLECLTTGPKLILQIVWFSASFFNLHCHIVSLNSPSSCLHILPHLFVTFIFIYTLPLETCFRRRFPCKMLLVQLAFLLLLLVRHFSPPWLFVKLFYFSLTIGPNALLHPTPAPHLKAYLVFLKYFSMCLRFSTIQSSSPSVAVY